MGLPQAVNAVHVSGGVPGYEIIDELGRGAMGVVYRARQVALKRDVALKMILVGGYSGEQERRRFLNEAELVAGLQHPGIVQVYDFGTHVGLPYFVMEFCPGGTLARKLAGKAMNPREAARLLEQLALAMQAAHLDVEEALVVRTEVTIRNKDGKAMFKLSVDLPTE